MNSSLYKLEDDRASQDDSRITTTVALLVIVVFTVSGSQTVPILIESASQGRSANPALISAFLLNIALVLLGAAKKHFC